MTITETIIANGHRNIRSTHKSTFEITKEEQLSKKGDCIIAVAADKGLTDLSYSFKSDILKQDSKISILIKAGEVADKVNALGSKRLGLTNPTDIVIRKSSYVCTRTLAIQADKAACDLTRKLVRKLRDPRQKIEITLTVEI